MPEHLDASSLLNGLTSLETMRLMLRLIAEKGLPSDSSAMLQKSLHAASQVTSSTKTQPDPIEALPTGITLECSGEINSSNSKTTFHFSICNPPFGALRPEIAYQLGTEDTRLENYFLRKCIQTLKFGGRCCCVVPNGFLSRVSHSDTQLRRILVEEQHLESVILLPLDCFPGASVYTAILTFVKTNTGGTNRVWVYDIRNRRPQEAEAGLVQYLSMLCGSPTPDSNSGISILELDALRKNRFFLLPECYHKDTHPHTTKRTGIDLQQLRSTREKIVRWREQPEQLNFFSKEMQNTDPAHVKDQIALNRLIVRYNKALMLQTFSSRFYRDESYFSHWPRVSGAELFTVRSGQKLKKEDRGGIYPVYGANGITRYSSSYNIASEQPFLIIGRVGSYCGSVQKAVGNCWITDNALYLTDFKQPIVPDFLWCLLQFMNLNQYKNGSCIPQITQALLLDLDYILPPLEEQTAFAQEISTTMEEYDTANREILQMREQLHKNH